MDGSSDLAEGEGEIWGLTGEDEGGGGAEEAEEGGRLVAAEDGRHGGWRGRRDLAGDGCDDDEWRGEGEEREIL
jgi:hypothetical protein